MRPRILGIGLPLLLLGAGKTHGAPATPPAATDATAVAQAGNRFGLDLYQRRAKGTGNLFFSPASLEMALAMAQAGAAGETSRQMKSVLHLEGDAAGIDKGFGALRAQLNAAGPKIQLSVANALWGQRQEPFRPEFLARLEGAFGAGMRRVDYARAEEARREINAWVGQQTRGRIPELLSAGSLDATTRLVLTNAVYFKGDWADAFEASGTRNETFTAASGAANPVPMMSRTDSYRYFADSALQVLELPYAGSDIGMMVLLPRDRRGLTALEKRLTSKELEGWIAKLASRSVEVHLPRFRMTTELSLGDELAAMGMADAFDAERADFSPMNGRRDLFISLVVHKAFVEVNEKGTEAAAASGIAMRTTSMVVDPQPPEIFRADHPFVFLIRDQRSGAILFMGRLADPKS